MSSTRQLKSLAAAVLAVTATAGLSACGSGSRSATPSVAAKNTSAVSIKTPSQPPLRAPSGVAVDAQGHVYVTDYDTGRLLEFSADGRYLTTIKTLQFTIGQPGCGPSDVVLGARGMFYVFDGCANSIDALTPSGRIVRRYPCPANGGCDHIALDGRGHVYANAYYQGVVEQYSLSTGRERVYHRFAQKDPNGLAFGPDGHMYVGLVADDRAVELSASGKQEIARSIQFGERPPLNEVDAVVPDSHGNVYIETGPDQTNLAIVKLSPALKRIRTIAPLGTRPGHVQFAWGMTVDSHGNVYVGEVGTHRIDKFSPAGKLLAMWH